MATIEQAPRWTATSSWRRPPEHTTRLQWMKASTVRLSSISPGSGVALQRKSHVRSADCDDGLRVSTWDVVAVPSFPTVS